MHTNVVGGCFSPAVLIGRDGSERLVFSALLQAQLHALRHRREEAVPQARGAEPRALAGRPGDDRAVPALDRGRPSTRRRSRRSRAASSSSRTRRSSPAWPRTRPFLSNTILIFGDNLGDRRLIFYLQSVSSFTDFDIQYWNLTNRMQKGIRVFDQRLFYLGIDQSSGFVERTEEAYRFTGVEAIVSYPLDRYRRLEGGLGYLWTKTSYPVRRGGTGSPASRPLLRPGRRAQLPGHPRGASSRTRRSTRPSGPTRAFGTSWTATTRPTSTGTSSCRRPRRRARRCRWTARSTSATTSRSPSGCSSPSASTAPRRPATSRSSGTTAGSTPSRGLEYASKYGNTVAFTNVEFRFPLIDLLAPPVLGIREIRGKVFFDVGFAELRGQDLDIWDSEENRLVVDLNSPTGAVADYGFGVPHQLPRLAAALRLRPALRLQELSVGLRELLLHRTEFLGSPSRSAARRAQSPGIGPRLRRRLRSEHLRRQSRLQFRTVPLNASLAIRVLGPYGGSAPGYRMTTFLVDGDTALDAGALTEALPLAAQRRLRRVVLTHAHFDHIASLPFLLENLYGRAGRWSFWRPGAVLRRSPATSSTTGPGRTSRKLPSTSRPTVRLVPIAEGRPFIARAAYASRPVRVDHVVPAYGYIVAKPGRAVALLGRHAAHRADLEPRRARARTSRRSSSRSPSPTPRPTSRAPPAT